ncbi:MAG: hypothetical protein WBF33_22000 [Candidatus Nitrosopolaris sp.]
MRSNKENINSLYRELQEDVITMKYNVAAVSKRPRNLAGTMRPTERGNYNAVIRPIRAL